MKVKMKDKYQKKLYEPSPLPRKAPSNGVFFKSWYPGCVFIGRGAYPLVDGDELYLRELQIESILQIEDLPPDLKILHLSANHIKRIEGLEKCPELIELVLDTNKITRIEGLEGCPKLRILNFWENDIEKIEGLENLHSLKELILGYNSIAKIEGLENCQNLRHLDLQYNQIKYIEGLENCLKLHALSLRGNPIVREDERYAGDPQLAVRYSRRKKNPWLKVWSDKNKKLDSFL